MSLPSHHPPRSSQPAISEQAATWVARRDRGLTPAEQDEYMQWLAADPRHAEAVAQHAAALGRMMTLFEWQPGQSAEPNPDLFTPPRRWRWRAIGLGLSIAAAVVLGVTAWWRPARHESPGITPQSYLRVNESRALADGSIVNLKDGSRITTDFSAVERRVHLTGEAHFNVTKDESRPFIVDAGGVAVRAVGTAFNVRVDADAVEVLVTHGTVRVNPSGSAVPSAVLERGGDNPLAPLVSARQRAIIARTTPAPPQVSTMSASEISEALSWQAPRLQFLDTPLIVAATEFNQRNRTQIVIGDADLKRVPIGGTFRVDNVEGFVRLIERTLDLKSETRGNEIVLRRAR